MLQGEEVNEGRDAPHHPAVLPGEEKSVIAMVEHRVFTGNKLRLLLAAQGNHPNRVIPIQLVGQLDESFQIRGSAYVHDFHDCSWAGWLATF